MQNWQTWLEIGLTVAVGFLVVRLVLRGLTLLGRSARFSLLAMRPLEIAVKWIGFLVVLALVLERFGFSVMTSLATMLAMVAIGVIAVWSMLSHITATFLLILLKPFRVKDRIGFSGEEVGGVVVDLNLFFTTLKSDEGDHFLVPNNMFFQKCLRVRTGKGGSELQEQLGESEPATD